MLIMSDIFLLSLDEVSLPETLAQNSLTLIKRELDETEPEPG